MFLPSGLGRPHLKAPDGGGAIPGVPGPLAPQEINGSPALGGRACWGDRREVLACNSPTSTSQGVYSASLFADRETESQ